MGLCQRSVPVKRRCCTAFALTTLLAPPLLTGCGDDNNPTEPIAQTEPKRGTPEELVESFFTHAYSKQDTARYENMLHAEFQFEFLAADAASIRLRPDSGIEPGQNYWGRASDLRSTLAMFRSQLVGQISLDIRAEAPTPSAECDSCVEVQSEITLRITTDPTSIDPLIFVVMSPQVFVARPDSADSTKWVLFRQYGREGAAARRHSSSGGLVGTIAGPGTEQSSWGAAKSLFR